MNNKEIDNCLDILVQYHLDILVQYHLDCRDFYRQSRGTSSPAHPDQIYVPARFILNVYQSFFPGIIRQERETDHSPTSSVDVV
jgi:hypothetical protein